MDVDVSKQVPTAAELVVMKDRCGSRNDQRIEVRLWRYNNRHIVHKIYPNFVLTLAQSAESNHWYL